MMTPSRKARSTGTISDRVVAAVISRDRRFLVCKRPAAKRHGGLWEFPGGKLELGEGDADAVARELHEELRVLTTSVGAVLDTLHDSEASLDIAFVAVTIAGEPTALEHDEIRWVTAAELASLALAPLDHVFTRTTFQDYLTMQSDKLLRSIAK